MQDVSNSSLFKYALFYDIDDYYKFNNPFKKDPYTISKQIKANFIPFLKDCLEHAYLHADAKEQLFCYYLLFSYVTEKYMDGYIQAFISSKNKKSMVEKMLETYFFNKNEKLKLSKTNIADYFFSSFELSISDFNLLEKPIKRQFGFFCIKNYFKECYLSARTYFDHYANHWIGLKKIGYFFYDFFFNHRKGKPKASTYLYPKKLDTKILNLTKHPFMLKNKEVSYSIDELYQELIKETRRAADALNSYFTGNQNLKPLEKYFLSFEQEKRTKEK